MGIIGFAIVISIIIALVFGWDYMVSVWSEVFNFIRELAGVMLDNLKGTTEESLI